MRWVQKMNHVNNIVKEILHCILRKNSLKYEYRGVIKNESIK